jgi:chaperonin GroEL (HSP60 family)
LCRQGAWLRRSPQGHAGRYRHLTGGTLISEDWGFSWKKSSCRPTWFAPRKSRSTRGTTTIVEGAGTRKDIESSASSRFAAIEQTDSDYDKEKFQERLAKLTGGVAVISVGAETEADMKQKKARVEDALHATRAAIEEGILPGGGVALLRCREAVEALRKVPKATKKSVSISCLAHSIPRFVKSPTTAASMVPLLLILSVKKRPILATTRFPASTKTCSRQASSIR